MVHKVLVIEDDQNVSRLVKLALECCGEFSCIVIPRLEAAWGILEREKIDLVFLDKYLEDSEGLEGLKEMLRIVPEVPIVIGTGDGDHGKAVRALEMGAQGCIFKPYDVGRLPKYLLDAIARQYYVNKIRNSRAPQKRSKGEWVAIITGIITILAAAVDKLRGILW